MSDHIAGILIGLCILSVLGGIIFISSPLYDRFYHSSLWMSRLFYWLLDATLGRFTTVFFPAKQPEEFVLSDCSRIQRYDYAKVTILMLLLSITTASVASVGLASLAGKVISIYIKIFFWLAYTIPYILIVAMTVNTHGTDGYHCKENEKPYKNEDSSK